MLKNIFKIQKKIKNLKNIMKFEEIEKFGKISKKKIGNFFESSINLKYSYFFIENPFWMKFYLFDPCFVFFFIISSQVKT